MTEKQTAAAVTNATEGLRDAQEAVELFQRVIASQAVRHCVAIPVALHIQKMQTLLTKLNQ